MSFDLDSLEKLRLSVLATYEGQEINNVFFYIVLPNATPTVFPVADGSDAMIDAFITRYRASILPLLSNGYVVRKYTLDRIINPGIAPIVSWQLDEFQETLGVPATDIGSGGAASLPSFVGVNVALKSGFHGRSDHGRKSFGPVPEVQSSDTAEFGNQLTAAALTSWQAAVLGTCTELVVGAGATGFLADCYIASLKNYKAGVVGFGRTVTSAEPSQILGSQVSRKQKARGS